MMIENIKYYIIISNGINMTYKRKTATILREDFEQLVLYIQQVTETVEILRNRYNKNFKFDDWLTALEVHADFLSKHLEKIFLKNGYQENKDFLKDWAKES